MRSLQSFLNRALPLLLLLACVLVSGCASVAGAVRETGEPRLRVAVMPLDNLSGTAAPLAEARRDLLVRAKELGLQIVDEAEFQSFITRHRIRYAGGIDRELSQALRTELKADAVIITSVELYDADAPPKIALSARLVTTGDLPMISWMDTVGIAGDDRPGILNLGLITDPGKLREKALGQLTRSLGEHLAKEARKGDAAGRYAPKIAFSALKLPQEKKPLIAVVPFFNQSMRRYAGEIQVLHFVKQLADTGRFDVIEPGMVRDSMLRMRIILNDGISIPHLDLLSIGLNVDYVLTGKVFDYQDYEGAGGRPRIDFSVQLVQRADKKIVWSSKSYNEGDDGVFFYDWGKLNTASALAAKMTRAVTEKMLKE